MSTQNLDFPLVNSIPRRLLTIGQEQVRRDSWNASKCLLRGVARGGQPPFCIKALAIASK